MSASLFVLCGKSIRGLSYMRALRQPISDCELRIANLPGPGTDPKSEIRNSKFEVSSDHLQQMPHLVLLGLEIFAGAIGGTDLEGDPFDDLQAVAADGDVLGRIVRHQAHAPHA